MRWGYSFSEAITSPWDQITLRLLWGTVVLLSVPTLTVFLQFYPGDTFQTNWEKMKCSFVFK